VLALELTKWVITRLAGGAAVGMDDGRPFRADLPPRCGPIPTTLAISPFLRSARGCGE